MSNELLAVLGGLVTFLLSVNAYYFKDIVTSLRKIELQLVKLTSEHDSNMMTVRKNEREIEKIRERLHANEGSSAQIVEFLKTIERNQ